MHSFSWRDRICYLLATAGGVGGIRWAPGTWGAAVAAGLYAVLACGWPTLTLPLLWCSLFAASAATVWLGPWAERYFGRKDASAFVLDEVAGLWLTLCLFPRDVAPWIALAWAFPITRLCDIVKLPPARQLERLPQGWGVLLDDLASSLHAALLLWLLAWLLPALFPVAR